MNHKTRPRAIVAFLSLIFLFSGKSFSQIRELRLRGEHIGTENGLSQGMVNCILQDSRGFMWFGTKDGLNRYDGYNFKVFRHRPDDSSSIADNFVIRIFEDSKKRIWFITLNHGLELYDDEKETFIHYASAHYDPLALRSDVIMDIEEDNLGTLWIATYSGSLHRIIFDDSGTPYPAIVDVQHHRFGTGVPFRIFRDRYGSLLVPVAYSYFGDGAGPFYPKQDSLFVGAIKSTARTTFAASEKYFTSQDTMIVYNCCESHDQQCIFFLTNKGVVSYNYLTGANNSFPMAMKTGHHASLIADEEGNIWIKARGEIIRLNLRDQQYSRVVFENIDPAIGIATNGIYEDHNGLIWFSNTGYGLIKLNTQVEKMHYIKGPGNAPLSPLSCVSINEFKPDSVAISSGSKCYLFNPNKNQRLDSSSVIDLKPAEPYSVVSDAEGNIWMNTGWFVTKLHHMKPDTAVMMDLPEEPGLLFPLFKDRAGELWTGIGDMLLKIDRGKHSFIRYKCPVKPISSDHHFIQTIYQDSAGNLWLGTTTGLLQFNEEKQSFKIFQNNPDDSSTLGFNFIFSLCPDPDQPGRFLWVGTNGGGLNKFDLQTGKVLEKYTDENGLPNNVVYGILDDRVGNIWLSTNNGIARFNAETKAFRYFTVNEGLQSNEFNRNAYCKTHSGYFFFGGVNGFNYFKPNELLDNFHEPPLQFTDFKLFNKSVSFLEPNAFLTKSITATSEITLPYDQNLISFTFAALDFTNSSKNQYMYLLEGFNKDWVHNGTGREATFTNLDPGTYYFKVKASNNDGRWNKEPRVLKLVVTPPWWKTWWFRIVAAAGIAFIARLIMKEYTGRKLRQQKIELEKHQAVENIRNRISRDIHDEIGSSLTKISLLSESLKLKVKETEAEGIISKITSSSRGVIGNMSEIIWATNPQHDNLASMISYFRNYVVQFFGDTPVLCSVDIPEDIPETPVSPELRRSLFLVLKESLNNILKHAFASNVFIQIKLSGNEIRMEIVDNGKGFNTEQNKKFSNGLKNMRKRMDDVGGSYEISSEIGKGTETRIICRYA